MSESAERDALLSLPADDPLVLAEHRRLIEAIEQVHRSARLLGLDPVEQYAALGVRVDAWQWRVERHRRAWRSLPPTLVPNRQSRRRRVGP